MLGNRAAPDAASYAIADMIGRRVTHVVERGVEISRSDMLIIARGKSMVCDTEMRDVDESDLHGGLGIELASEHHPDLVMLDVGRTRNGC